MLLLLTPLYWFARVQLKAECLMTLPVLALGLAWARKLRDAHPSPAIAQDGTA